MKKKELTKFLRKNLNINEFHCVYQFMIIDEIYAEGESNDYAIHTLECFVRSLISLTLGSVSQSISESISETISKPYNDPYNTLISYSINYSIESLIDILTFHKTLLIAALKLTRALNQPKEEE